MRNEYVSFVFLMLAASVLQGCTLYLRKEFVGYVVERESLKPVVGVTVVAEYNDMFALDSTVVTSTDDRGRFEISIPNNDGNTVKVGAVSRVIDGQTVWQGGHYFGPTKKWYREHGGWLEGVGYPTIMVWFTPASKETPPDFADMNNPIPPYQRAAAARATSTAPSDR